jgi:hypothetical protein
MTRKPARGDGVIHLMDGQEHVHYSLPLKSIDTMNLRETLALTLCY